MRNEQDNMIASPIEQAERFKTQMRAKSAAIAKGKLRLYELDEKEDDPGDREKETDDGDSETTG